MSESNFTDYEISDGIKKALNLLKYKTPTKVQSEVIPKAFLHQDLVVNSQTGTGKTAAFGIPVCEMIQWESKKPQALILTPTRELAVQVKEDIKNIGRFKLIKTIAIYGQEPFSKQKAELKQKTHVVVGTPGRVLDHMERGTLALDEMKFLIIDEADEMLNMGFIDTVEKILKQLPVDRVTMVFSATLSLEVKQLCNKYMKEPKTIVIEATEATPNKTDHYLIKVKQSDKLKLLKDVTIIENPDSCIIFCNTKEYVDQVFTELEASKYSCKKLHGGLEQNDRFEIMDGFKKGHFRYLVATDVAARGIDVDNVSLVINYDIPIEKESYVHRTGRTGRFGNKGKAISFESPHDGKYLKSIHKFIGFQIPMMVAPRQHDVDKAQAAFNEKLSGRRVVRNNKSERINKDIMKLHFNGGKKKKLRAIDFVGTITNIPGVTKDDIGIITIKDTLTYVDVLNGKGSLVLETMETTPVKGKKLKVSLARK